MGSRQDYLVRTDLRDRALGLVSREEAHEGNGILHRALIIIVRNSEGKYLLARRSNEKQLWAETFDLSIATHPRSNETYKFAARRRLSEELGTSSQVRPLGVFSYFARQGEKCENELCRVFLAELDEDKIKPDPHEISNILFRNKQEVLKLYSEGRLTPWANLVIQGGYLEI